MNCDQNCSSTEGENRFPASASCHLYWETLNPVVGEERLWNSIDSQSQNVAMIYQLAGSEYLSSTYPVVWHVIYFYLWETANQWCSSMALVMDDIAYHRFSSLILRALGTLNVPSSVNCSLESLGWACMFVCVCVCERDRDSLPLVTLLAIWVMCLLTDECSVLNDCEYHFSWHMLYRWPGDINWTKSWSDFL